MSDTQLTLTVEIFEDNDEKMIWIGSENGSGAEYPIKKPEDIGDAINTYIHIYYPEVIKFKNSN